MRQMLLTTRVSDNQTLKLPQTARLTTLRAIRYIPCQTLCLEEERDMSSSAAAAVHDPERLTHAISTFTKVTAEADSVESVEALLQSIAAALARLVGVTRCSIHMRED